MSTNSRKARGEEKADGNKREEVPQHPPEK